ncbi:unnamed protein product, partial [marine sediment metagenome]
GTMAVPQLKVGDGVEITWSGTYKTKSGMGFKFTVGIKKN